MQEKKILKELNVLRSEGQISMEKDNSQSDVSSFKNKPQMRSTQSQTASRKEGDLLHWAPVISCLGTIHWINYSQRRAK